MTVSDTPMCFLDFSHRPISHASKLRGKRIIRKKVCLSYEEPPGHESDTLPFELPGWVTSCLERTKLYTSPVSINSLSPCHTQTKTQRLYCDLKT